MSIDDRTPGTREVRSMYCAGSNLYRETPEQHYLGAPAPDYGAEFDRFLARVRREAKAEGWDDCERSLHRWFNDSFAGDEPPRNPYRATETGDNDDYR